MDGLLAVMLFGLCVPLPLSFAAVAAWLAGLSSQRLLVSLLKRDAEDDLWDSRIWLRLRLATIGAVSLGGFAASLWAERGKAYLWFFFAILAYDGAVCDLLFEALDERVVSAQPPSRAAVVIRLCLESVLWGITAVAFLGPQIEMQQLREVMEGFDLVGMAAGGSPSFDVAGGSPVAVVLFLCASNVRQHMGWLVHGMVMAVVCSCAVGVVPMQAAMAMCLCGLVQIAWPKRDAELSLLIVSAIVLLSGDAVFTAHLWTEPLTASALVAFGLSAWSLR